MAATQKPGKWREDLAALMLLDPKVPGSSGLDVLDLFYRLPASRHEPVVEFSTSSCPRG